MQQSAITPEGAVRGNTLREAIEIRRVRGERFSLKEAIGIIVPMTTQIAALHADGRTFFVSPSAIDHGRAGSELVIEAAGGPPAHERDRACIAPELRSAVKAGTSRGGDSRASVFAIGAILYELVTGESVGPGMRRPSEAAPGLPANVEVVLGKALVADPTHRPGDLAALAQALHQLCPAGSMPPPAADVSHLDQDGGFEVDVSLSMIPPPPAQPRLLYGSAGKLSELPSGNGYRPVSTDGPYAVMEARPPASTPNPADPTARLAALKASVEGDPRPRYVVVKDGMDHGPFTGVELLQHIATRTFLSEHFVRDTISGDDQAIKDWAEFAPFAEQAKLNQDIKEERNALEAVVVAEKTGLRLKALVGVGLIVILGAAGVGFWLRKRANSTSQENVRADNATVIDSAGGLGSAKSDGKTPAAGGHWSGNAGSYPVVAGGKSCEAARASYVEDYSKQGVPPDLGAADFGNVLNRGGYLNACGVPSNMAVSICVAVQNGAAVGVTVSTKPSDPRIAGCISAQVRGLGFPPHPRLDIATTTFAAQ